jgi:Jacalin-like lectin domain
LQINLHPNEYLTSVKGYYGDYVGFEVVMSLSFETNLQTYGPYGREEGVPFHLPTHGGKIIGFHGRSGQLIDAIGTYVKFD